ncbi:hypothetical protein [Candidatus Epulonipiscium viviparus]|nr:hypothetical protein [Candidatus Epulopiscium viviparus]
MASAVELESSSATVAELEFSSSVSAAELESSSATAAELES